MVSMKVLIFVISVQLWICLSQGTAKFGNLKCDVLQTDLISLEECHIKAINRSYNVVNVKYILKKKVPEFQLNFKLLKRERGGWHPFLYDINVNMCEFLKRPYKYVIFNAIYQYGQKFTSLNHSCPYMPNMEVALMNWSLTENEVFQKFPVELGVYAAHTTWYMNKKKFLQMNGTVIFE
ncbi:uncharacterized protein LOC133845575 [Drosophila sulfurigaster albostrigata]|uniref:uncharacterized protein LOC133845575 n=1 Tax=Drosophila sulfurigaster albostrigata TaxID=89887 RepID=UPI002D21A551|nr:uncharacterized protein LOC133845575 [Drosophila sulfurigaster albostrigata]